MQTTEVKELERSGNEAVKQLRKAKHDKGLPFMINSLGSSAPALIPNAFCIS